MNNQQIFQWLKKLHKNAYAKYSNYHVSCLVKVDKEVFIEGVNVENAVHNLGLCAERTAINNAITKGYKQIIEVHLLTSGKNKNFGSPCGACRQVIFEFASNQDISVFLYNLVGDFKEVKLSDLLPLPWENE